MQVYIVFTERQPATADLPELEASAAVSSFHHDMLSDLLDDRLVGRCDRWSKLCMCYTYCIYIWDHFLTRA